MGRRIYEDGNFVWKYTFGRQSSNMPTYAEDYDIGIYNYGKNDTAGTWVITKKELPKLTALLKLLSNGHTRNELNKIGMKAIKIFVSKQNINWKLCFKNDITKLKTYKSEKDFEFYGSSNSGMSFEIYDIFAKAIEAKIKGDFDFYKMTETFINYIINNKKQTFNFMDEW